jgi:hypothetical protein
VAALRRGRARVLVPRELLRAAQRLQSLEISNPRSCRAQETLVRQSTSSAQQLERAQVSKFDGIIFTELLHLPSGRVHRVAHPAAHRAKHREVGGVGQVFFDDRDGDVEDQARDRDARLCVELRLSLARAARLDTARCLGDHRGGRRVHCARRCACRAECAKCDAAGVRTVLYGHSVSLIIPVMFGRRRRGACSSTTQHRRVRHGWSPRRPAPAARDDLRAEMSTADVNAAARLPTTKRASGGVSP